jgi:hypothetical protein
LTGCSYIAPEKQSQQRLSWDFLLHNSHEQFYFSELWGTLYTMENTFEFFTDAQRTRGENIRRVAATEAIRWFDENGTDVKNLWADELVQDFRNDLDKVVQPE